MNMSNKSVDNLVFHERTEMIYKIIVIGDPNVGKTKLLTNFCGDKFMYEYVPTVGVNITKERVTVKNDKGRDTDMSLMVWDIAGQPQFYMLHRPYFNGADGMILVYNAMHSSSFSHIIKWYLTAIKFGLSEIPRILVGIKNTSKEERRIPLSLAKNLSKELNAPFFETSTLTGEITSAIFLKMAELTLLSKF